MLMRNLRKYIRQNKAKNMIQNQTNQKLMKQIRQKIQNYLNLLIGIKKNKKNDYPVDTDIDLETNEMKKTELSTSNSLARQLTENPD